MAATIKDLARESGVSPSTVSYVLNNGPRPVSRRTREKVLAIAKKLNYQPNAVARGLSRRKMDTIGIIYTYLDADNTDYYFISILHGILGACMRHSQAATLFTSHAWEDVPANMPLYCNGRCDGLIVVAPPAYSGFVQEFSAREMPVVVINEIYPDPKVASVDIDNELAMYEMTQYLLSLGHRRIALFCGDANQSSAVLRERGFRKAFAEAKLPEELFQIVPGSYRPASGYQNALKVVKQPEQQRPTALCCASDAIAAGAMQALIECGISVPDQMSVTGIDDVPIALTTAAPLTSIRQPFTEIGMHAAEFLLARIAGDATVRQELLPATLVVRKSSAPPCR